MTSQSPCSDRPAAIGALDLDEGSTTTRHVACCPQCDAAYADDSRARFDWVLGQAVHYELNGEQYCNECGCRDEAETTPMVFDNAALIARACAALDREIAILEAFTTQPPARLTVCRCSACGSEDVDLDAISEYNPETNDHDLITTYDKGHSCPACGDDEASIDEVLISAHQILRRVAEVCTRLEHARKSRKEITDWLARETLVFD